MKVNELDQITGTLSKPSKMPGWAYGIPAKECKVGSKLAKIPGTVCHGCYALKGCYVFPNVQAAQYKRLDSITDPRWVQAMAAQILRHKSKWFRWHDSGDIQSLKHLAKIFKVARLTPDVNHWLPTREAWVKPYLGRAPKNLVIRFSMPMVDQPAAESWSHTSTVVSGSGRTCPAPDQNNACSLAGVNSYMWNPGSVPRTFLKPNFFFLHFYSTGTVPVPYTLIQKPKT